MCPSPLPPAGEIKQEEFAATGIDGELFADIDKALDERTIGHNPERLSLLKGGIVYSNAVTTVSPTYAKEVLSGGASGWLRETMAKPHITAKVRSLGRTTSIAAGVLCVFASLALHIPSGPDPGATHAVGVATSCMLLQV